MGRASSLSVTWVGHSTVLVELDGVRFLTDPLLRRRVAHLRRLQPLDVTALGRIDVVLVSHEHYDHLDVPSLRKLDPSIQVLAPSGAKPALRRARRDHAPRAMAAMTPTRARRYTSHGKSGNSSATTSSWPSSMPR